MFIRIGHSPRNVANKFIAYPGVDPGLSSSREKSVAKAVKWLYSIIHSQVPYPSGQPLTHPISRAAGGIARQSVRRMKEPCIEPGAPDDLMAANNTFTKPAYNQRLRRAGSRPAAIPYGRRLFFVANPGFDSAACGAI